MALRAVAVTSRLVPTQFLALQLTLESAGMGYVLYIYSYITTSPSSAIEQ